MNKFTRIIYVSVVAWMMSSGFVYGEWWPSGSCAFFLSKTDGSESNNCALEDPNWAIRISNEKIVYESDLFKTTSYTREIWRDSNNSPCGNNSGSSWVNNSQSCLSTSNIGNNLGAPSCVSPSVGNPISIAGGNKFQQELDLNDHKGFPIVIERSYNSDGGGFWMFSFQQSYQYSVSQIATYNDQQLYQNVFVWNAGDGGVRAYSYLSVNDSGAIFEKLGVKIEASENGAELVDRDGVTYQFSEGGLLAKKVDLTGREISYEYNSEGFLEKINGIMGSYATISYDGDNIKRISLSNGEYMDYAYSEGRLVSVINAGGDARIYLYENEAFPDLLTGITDERGVRYASWEYNDLGQAVSSAHSNGAEKVTLSFDEDKTIVTDSLGKVTEYTFENFSGVKKLVKVDGYQSENCAAAQRIYTYYTIENQSHPSVHPNFGMIKSTTDWRGQVTEYEYNERGFEIARTEAAGTDQARTILTEWHSSLNVPVKVSLPERTIEYFYDDSGNLKSTNVKPGS